jgi:short-subunit dehydrogenase
VKASVLVADLRLDSERIRTIDVALERLGHVDVLVNNAGVEYSAAYHDLTSAQIIEVLNVNLEAPMRLAHLVLPGMLERRRGHILNISSLAGKAGPGFQEPYAASKAGLSAFTYSLRNTYRGTGVSASVITPGFVDAGIYARMKNRTGRGAPPLLAACSAEKVARATLRALTRDRAEIIVNTYPMRPLLACMALWSGFAERVPQWTGANAFFRAAAEAERQNRTNRTNR